MAKIISIPISGKVGLEVSMPGRYGQVRRAWIVPANPQTSDQLAVRSRLTTQAQRFQTLTASQQTQWNVFAAGMNTRSRLGTNGPMTGLQMFVKLNTTLTMFGQEPIDVPPALTVLGAPAPQSLSITNVSDVIAVKLAVPTSPGTNTVLRASLSVSSAVSKCPSLRILGMCPAPSVGSSDITSLYVAKFGAPLVGKRIYVSAAVTENGFMGIARVMTAVVPESS